MLRTHTARPPARGLAVVLADVVVLSWDIMTIWESEIQDAEIVYSSVGGP